MTFATFFTFEHTPAEAWTAPAMPVCALGEGWED
jgi:hypothetical protein